MDPRYVLKIIIYRCRVAGQVMLAGLFSAGLVGFRMQFTDCD
jgi:hypothetical protein